jgi:hypothetical protein
VYYGQTSASCPIPQNNDIMPFAGIDNCSTNLLFTQPGKKYGNCATDEGLPILVRGPLQDPPRILPEGEYCFSFYAFNPAPKPNPFSGRVLFFVTVF